MNEWSMLQSWTFIISVTAIFLYFFLWLDAESKGNHLIHSLETGGVIINLPFNSTIRLLSKKHVLALKKYYEDGILAEKCYAYYCESEKLKMGTSDNQYYDPREVAEIALQERVYRFNEPLCEDDNDCYVRQIYANYSLAA